MNTQVPLTRWLQSSIPLAALAACCVLAGACDGEGRVTDDDSSHDEVTQVLSEAVRFVADGTLQRQYYAQIEVTPELVADILGMEAGVPVSDSLMAYWEPIVRGELQKLASNPGSVEGAREALGFAPLSHDAVADMPTAAKTAWEQVGLSYQTTKAWFVAEWEQSDPPPGPEVWTVSLTNFEEKADGKYSVAMKLTNSAHFTGHFDGYDLTLERNGPKWRISHANMYQGTLRQVLKESEENR